MKIFILKKIAFDSETAGALAGLVAGYSSGRSAAGTTANRFSSHGSKVKNEIDAKNMARFTSVLGGLGGIYASSKYKDNILGVVNKKTNKGDILRELAPMFLPAASALAGSYIAGKGTGALYSLRGRQKKEASMFRNIVNKNLKSPSLYISAALGAYGSKQKGEGAMEGAVKGIKNEAFVGHIGHHPIKLKEFKELKEKPLTEKNEHHLNTLEGLRVQRKFIPNLEDK